MMRKQFIIAIVITAIFTMQELMAQDRKHNNSHPNSERVEKANEHMHRSSIEELVKRFESPERDRYQQPDKVLEYLGEIIGKNVMDIGAGTGYFSVKLAKKGAKVIAADVNDEFQRYLEKRIEEDKLQNITLRKTPHDNPALADGEVDKILIVNTYHHIEKRPEYFRIAKKGIAEGGELVIVDFFKTDIPVGPPTGHKVSIDEVISELKEAGYADFDVKVDLLPYQFVIKAK
ncbi:methyltransferase domain-containing protein [Olivibacter sp. SDN3]|uniref:class I SAM-dependent methyltransferase n=1 Tax=Olivibacter sp. SDN3 TaxID=2764720 RepID=UPI0016511005|nr:class I SAM-dependent methyltransferase [Olivibacter sp. SDN3]QNL49688.1 methyltransferase domain-containing protein [Olivibacter sp. SDN3]